MIETLVSESHTRLYLIREFLELTRRQMAELLGLKYRTYNKYETHNKLLPPFARKRMIELNLNPLYLEGVDEITINSMSLEKVKETIQNNF